MAKGLPPFALAFKPRVKVTTGAFTGDPVVAVRPMFGARFTRFGTTYPAPLHPDAQLPPGAVVVPRGMAFGRLLGSYGIPTQWGGFGNDTPNTLTISGVTKDSTGAVLGGCKVHLFTTDLDTLVAQITSDPTTGVYSFTGVGMGRNYYVVAYKAGSPDVAGTTVNTLTGTG